MRRFFLILFTLSISAASAEEPAEDVLEWQHAFSPVTASQANGQLALILITNDEQSVALGVDSKDDGVEQAIWCKANLELSLRRMQSRHGELTVPLILQVQAAGLPKHLSGGEDRNQPARCLLAICDRHYRLLSFCIGVPGPDDLLTLIEDAQQVSSLLVLSRDSQPAGQKLLTTAIADQAMKRLTRLWRDALKEMLVAIDVGATEETEGTPAAFDVARVWGRLTEAYNVVYLADVKLRFGFNEAGDRVRLAVLEQHPEARRPWCEVMMPFLAGSDFSTLWKPLTESVWGHQPVTLPKSEATELSDWYDAAIDKKTVVLNLQPSNGRQRVLPVIDVRASAARRPLGWSDLQRLVTQFPNRNVTTQELSDLTIHRDIKRVDLLAPSRAKYLVIEPKGKSVWAIREGESLAKSIGRLKRHIE